MSALSRWNPFKTSTRFDPVAEVDDLFRGLGFRLHARDPESPLDMRMDVREQDGAYRVSVDLPGVDKDRIEVSVDGSQVSIKAELERESRRETDREVHTERYAGSSFRAFSLRQEIDPAKSEAHYDKGVLTLTLPKKPNGNSRRLPIS